MVPDNSQSEEITHFILWFSRYEFALKNAGFHREGITKLEPDWDKLINYFVQEQNEVPQSLQQVLEYFQTYPVKKQNINKDWEPILRISNWDWLIRSLTSIRNNLFHGGKHRDVKLLADPRDRQLVQYCQKIMNEIYPLCPPEIQALLS